MKLPHVNKNPLARRRIFFQTPFSHSTLKLEQKHFTPPNHSLFRSTSCFGVTRDQNHYSNLTSKIMKICEQILKNSRKNSRNDSNETIAHTYEQTTRTTIVNPEPPQMP